MSFTESIFEKLKRHPKRIVFPEGSHPNVIKAARMYADNQLGIPVLLGDKERILKTAASLDISLEFIRTIDPAKSSEFPVFCERLKRLDRYRRLKLGAAEDIMKNPCYFGAMMLQYGQVDGYVGGVEPQTGSIFRPLLKLVKPLPDAKTTGSCLIVELPRQDIGHNGILFLAECGVLHEPDIEQIAAVGMQTGLMARQLFGTRPRVAMISFSTKGSVRTPSTEKMEAAVGVAKEWASKENMDIAVDGEMQIDVALVPAMAAAKMPKPSLVAGKANVLVFPELNSASVAAKLIEHLVSSVVYGQLVIGLTRPAADVGREASPEKIVNMAAIVGLQSVEYRKLYPEKSAD
ncbi:MAG: phosphate acyltransferase [Chthoniobacterales bacterium]